MLVLREVIHIWVLILRLHVKDVTDNNSALLFIYKDSDHEVLIYNCNSLLYMIYYYLCTSYLGISVMYCDVGGA